MRVLVIGATGLTGRIAVQRLLERGEDVTALARAPRAVTMTHTRLRIATGEARDPLSLERAVEGHDAVLSAFGPRSLQKDDVQEVFMRNLVGAMEKMGVMRLSNLSAWGAGNSFASLPPLAKLLAFVFLRNLLADKDRGEKLLFGSTLDYVNVRPGRLTNGPARGGVQASLNAKELHFRPLAREDLATFMVEQLTSDKWVRKSPLLSY